MRTPGPLDSKLQGSVNNIHTSLVPLIFARHDSRGRPLAASFRRDHALHTGANICRLGGLVLQAYCIHLKSQEAEVPQALEDLIAKLWTGRLHYDEHLAWSILHTASLHAPGTGLQGLIGPAEIFVEWQRLLSLRKLSFKEYDVAAGRVQWDGALTKLLTALPILSRCQFSKDAFLFEGSGKVWAFPLVHYSPDHQGFFYFYSVQRNGRNTEVCLAHPHGDLMVTYAIRRKDPVSERFRINQGVLGVKPAESGVVHLFGNHFGHIAALARAISVTETDAAAGARKDVLRQYKSEIRVCDSLADSLIYLIADKGPARILRTALTGHLDACKDYLRTLEQYGCGPSGFAESCMQDIEEQLRDRDKTISECLDLDRDYGRGIRSEAVLDIMCWGVLRAAGLDIESPRAYVESIGMRASMCSRWKTEFESENVSIEQVSLRVLKMVERTFKFLIAFYHGLTAYYRVFLTTGQHAASEAAMIEQAGSRYRRTSKLPPGELVDELRKLIMRSEQPECLVFLGRPNICSPQAFDKLVTSIWRDGFIGNRVKHDSGNSVTREEVKMFLDGTTRLFKFLQRGHIDNPNGPIEPVYAHVVSFELMKRDRDGLTTYRYQISSGEPEQARMPSEVGILTERNYVPDEEYYCIPMLNRMTDRWWIEPFMIRCSSFNQALTE